MGEIAAATRLDGGFVEGLMAVDARIGHARGLPNAAYTDRDFAAFEQRRLWRRGWACVGFAGDVPHPGDARPVELGGAPLLLLRAKDGAVRVFHNVCRHRGMKLATEPTRFANVIRCPYHSWCYDHGGKLVIAPHVGGPGRNVHPDMDRSELGLVPVRTAVWWDFVFVDLDGEAPAFEDWIAPLARRWHGFDVSRFRAPTAQEGAFRLELSANWKLAVENYVEAYHLPWVHPGLNSYSRLEDHDNIVENGAFSGQLTRAYRPTLDDAGRRFPGFEDLDPFWASGAEYVALYPNLLLGVHRDQGFAILVEPEGVARTTEHVRLYYLGEAATDPELAALRRRSLALWREVFEEDVAVVEGMQAGRASPAFDGGRFSPAMDPPTHAFHRWVAGRLLAP
jgi:phenylpropionate dioxygenase-like ring-hydroxylating dioxygenase large terminal subunit